MKPRQIYVKWPEVMHVKYRSYALTANAFTADVAKSRSVGMNDHVAKPIDIERLMETLQRWIVSERIA